MSKKPLEIDMIAGSQLRDTQGEMLSVDGADISDLEAGRGRFNDNHGKGFFNSIGRITTAKKIYGPQDCTEPRHTYYWEKVKSPFIYVKGYLYNDDDHPNAKAAAAILRNIHKNDCPLKLKASVEGGVLARGLSDPNLLARTKIHSVALTFTPANQNTLVEPTILEKNDSNWEADQILIKSVMHLAKIDVPSFRHITRRASAERIINNFDKIKELASTFGLTLDVDVGSTDDLVKSALHARLAENIKKINELTKALTAGYGGAGAPTSRTGGAVIQTESMNGRGFRYVTCPECGHEQVYMKHQVKCRECNKNLPLAKLYGVMVQGG
jgi:ribosomal protein S27E